LAGQRLDIDRRAVWPAAQDHGLAWSALCRPAAAIRFPIERDRKAVRQEAGIGLELAQQAAMA
jgi:hypothetical protein